MSHRYGSCGCCDKDTGGMLPDLIKYSNNTGELYGSRTSFELFGHLLCEDCDHALRESDIAKLNYMKKCIDKLLKKDGGEQNV